MNDQTPNEGDSEAKPQPAKVSWSDADHPGIDYQKKRSQMRTVGLTIVALIGGALILLALVFGGCVMVSRL